MSNYKYSGKDKGDLHTFANTRLNDRELIDIEIFGKTNINEQKKSIYIERDEFLKNSKNNKIFDNDSFEDDSFNNFANINKTNKTNIINTTNTTIFDDFKDANRGMPIRSQNIYYKKSNKDQSKEQSEELPNFIIKNTSNRTNNAFSKACEPYVKDTKFSIFSDINENFNLTSSLENDNIIIKSINDFSLFLLKNLNNILTSPFVINTIDIYLAFSSIYLASRGNTEIELKNYFNFPKKDILHDGLNKIIEKFKETTFKTGNCLLFNDNITFNPDFYKLINNISKLRKININNITTEVNNINNIVNSITEHNMKKSITYSNIENMNILLLTLGFFKPTIIINSSDKPQLTKNIFKSKFFNNITVDYVSINNVMTGFVENNLFNIVEFALDDAKTILGIISPKINITQITEKDIINSLDKLKVVYFNNISFPLFAIQTKLRFRNIFKKTDLKTIFDDINCPDLFKDTSKIDDILQNVEINIFPEFKNIKLNSKNKNNKNLIINNTFIFYLRLRENLCLLTVGIY